jgi:hypothetical protein
MVSERDQGQDKATSGGEPAFTRPPQQMYVHYITRERTPPAPDVYLFQIDSAALVNEIKTAIDLIRQGKVPKVKPGPDGVEWHSRSYVVFVMDLTGHKITGVDFKHQGTNNNYTFEYRGKIDNHNGSSAVYYLNKRRNKMDQPLGDEQDIVAWEVIHTLAAAAEVRILTHQGSDPNTGP